MRNVTESIFSGNSVVVPMAEVVFIHKHYFNGFSINIVFRGSPVGDDGWHEGMANLSGEEAESFLKCWCKYRSEIESETLSDLMPSEIFSGTAASLDKLSISPTSR